MLALVLWEEPVCPLIPGWEQEEHHVRLREEPVLSDCDLLRGHKQAGEKYLLRARSSTPQGSELQAGAQCGSRKVELLSTLTFKQTSPSTAPLSASPSKLTTISGERRQL